MFEWASSIIAAAVITAAAVFIIPDTENGKQISSGIKFLGSLLSLYLIISPVPEILKSISSFFDSAVIKGESEITSEDSFYSELVFNEALKNFENSTFALTENRFGRNDFNIRAQADKELTDITVTVTYFSEDFPTDKVCAYIQYLYSDSVNVTSEYNGQYAEKDSNIIKEEAMS